ncbi:MAG: efflux RND transporter periplasmic adaptor subunit [Nitrosomonadales bacterium]|nr:efflux RND transporter periplasmic adaptor subunit [Nitrosomonadales bacterium]
MKTTHILTTSTLFAALLMLAACGPKGDGQQAPAGAGAPPPEVDVLSVTSGSVVLTQDLPGRMEAFRTAQVRARVEGIVEKRLFAEGIDVKKGEALFHIYAANYRANFEAAKADLVAARQNLESAKKLLETRFISPQSYDQTAAKFKQAEAAYSRAHEDIDNTSVPAPISGRIGRAMVTEGALVGRGDATLLATVEQIDPIYANFTRPGSELQQLHKAFKSGKLKEADAGKVELVLEDGSIYPQQGILLFSNLAVDPGTGSISLRAEFPNKAHELLPGMFVRVRFPESVAEDSIRIPQRAVQIGAQGQFVLLVDGEGKVVPRPVKTGQMVGADFIITEGLQVGDQVIVNGVQKARPGSPVKAVPLGQADNAAAASAPAATAQK